MTVSGEEATESVSSLNMLCSLWDSVKDLIMTCATTKIKVTQQTLPFRLPMCIGEIDCMLFGNYLWNVQICFQFSGLGGWYLVLI